MTSRDFAYWLQGFFEISGDDLKTIEASQLEQIKKHLSMVFVHEIDPSHGGPEQQAALNAVHNHSLPLTAALTNEPPRPGGMVARC